MLHIFFQVSLKEHYDVILLLLKKYFFEYENIHANLPAGNVRCWHLWIQLNLNTYTHTNTYINIYVYIHIFILIWRKFCDRRKTSKKQSHLRKPNSSVGEGGLHQKSLPKWRLVGIGLCRCTRPLCNYCLGSISLPPRGKRL